MVNNVRKTWKYADKKDFSEELIKTCGSKIIAELLTKRGITNVDEAEAFLNISESQLSSPYEFEDMEKLVDRVSKVIENEENIVIWGDFDADGITGTSILFKTLKHIGANVSFYVPERVDEGHGINSTSLLKLISTRKLKLLITTDCGISNLEEISLAKSFGVETIITDHHELPEVLPPAKAIINPKTLSSNSKMAHLCGAGVAYKVSEALLKYFDKQEFLNEIIYLAAIGTIADLVPLKYENRVIVYLGIKNIIENKPMAMVEIAKGSNLKLDESFNSYSIAFNIGPRLNAIGRLDNASNAVDLLTTDDPEKARILTLKLEQVNRQRQELCDQTYNEAVSMLSEKDLKENKAIVLANKNWHPGVIGIVASRLIETFYRPVFLMSIQGEEVRGSARSISGVHLFDVLSRLSDLFSRFGGHELAAGFNLHINDLNKFKNRIHHEVNFELQNIEPTPTISIDMEVMPEDLNVELIETLNKLEPYGMGNQRPVLSATNLNIFSFKAIGSDNNHLKIYFRSKNNSAIEAVWWQNNTINFDTSQLAKVAFYPELNIFQSKVKIQLVIKDLLPVSEAKIQPENKINKIKWIDHRKKSDIFSVFNNYKKVSSSDIAIFAESKHFINIAGSGYSILNRLSNEKASQLIILEYPATEDVLKSIIINISPEIIHLAPYISYTPLNEMDILRTVMGMLKYAYSNNNGEANINIMASKLATSIKAISISIDILSLAGIIKLNSFKDNIVKIELKEFTGMNVSKINELSNLKNELQEVLKFRKTLLYKPIEEFFTY